MRFSKKSLIIENKYFDLRIGRIPETGLPGIEIILLQVQGAIEEREGIPYAVCKGWFSFSFLSGWRLPYMGCYWRKEPLPSQF